MMSFWDTTKGQELAEVLIRELPRLNEKKKCSQVSVNTSDLSGTRKAEEMLASGKYHFDGSYTDHQGSCISIFSKID